MSDSNEEEMFDFSGAMSAMMGGKVEPSSDLISMAKWNFQVYQAHVDAGFRPDQALSLVSSMLISILMNPDNGGSDGTGNL